MSLLIIGTVAFDEIETPFANSGKIIGGSGTYAALSAARFTDGIDIVSIIGEDFGDDNLKLLAERGIGTSGVEQVAGEKTFFWRGRYHNDMNSRDTLETQLNVLAQFDPEVPQELRNARFLMLGNLTPAVQMKVLKQMNKRPELVIMDTMNFWMDSAWDELLEVIAEVDVLTINDEEARQLSGEYALPMAAKKIFTMGPKYLIIKKGEHGALLFHQDKIFYAPALPLEKVFDPTGAGDTFAGGFIGHLAHSQEINFENMKRAVIYGSAMASFCVEEFGPERLLNLDRKAIHERVMQFIDLTQFEMQLDS